MDNVVKQTQLKTVWVSTVDISVNTIARAMDTMFEVIAPEGLGRPYDESRATEFQFETMVFPSEGEGASDWGELDCQRYNSLEDAKTGHKTMVDKWRKQEKGNNG